MSNRFGVESIRSRCDRVRQGIAWAYSKGKGVGGARAGGRFGGGGAATTGKGAAARSEIWVGRVDSTRSRIDSESNVWHYSVFAQQEKRCYGNLFGSFQRAEEEDIRPAFLEQIY